MRTAEVQGSCSVTFSRPVVEGGNAARIFSACLQHTNSSGAPITQRQATSSAVSDGRTNTHPICATADCVPRTGWALMLFDNEVHGFPRHDDHLDHIFAGRSCPHSF